MSQAPERYRSANQARRHFLGIAAATSARAAAIGTLAMTALSSSAHAAQRSGDQGDQNDQGDQGGGRPHCYLRGTAILTPTGEVRIEDLRIGDLVETVRGEAMPIKWIGRHVFRKSGSSWSKSVMPIRVSRHALDARTPQADLYLSPEHALFIDGVLMPVRELVNGISIVPALPEGTEVIEYFQILLDSHEVILAEGAPTETYLLRGRDYESFTNFIEYERLYGHEPRPALTPFAPLVSYNGGRAHLKALLLLGISPFVQVRDPVGSAYERLATRAEELVS
ncbi:Hint domain-containing protein [Microvirga massiliensis]|uniref:Hint domain-containing protein n=1 Tax=Microvirga massiliensis TaxID=1033741 RepID=UPI00062B856E|nr:Hint domain-containing protein [Microvirga massiliensis]